jgi:poly-gamma-glutamate capsule biosynthesis protein CapA/YwtB (metallophosphatase superfamily)
VRLANSTKGNEMRACIFFIWLILSSASFAQSVRLIFTGDIMLDDTPGKVIAEGRDPFASVAELLRDADFRIGNLECPIATVGKAMESKIFSFRAHPRVLPMLEHHIDAVSVANNHSGDYGKEAFIETLAHLDSKGILHFGGGKNATDAHRPLWLDRNGLRIAVLGYNEFKPRSFEAGALTPGIAWSEDSHVVSDIRAARRAGADVVIPFMHWGWERETTASDRQKKLARKMIDAGADIVVGSHPHVVQGAEIYKGKPIIYSLGNFVFDSFTTPVTTLGWTLHLTLDKRGVASWTTRAVQMDEEGSPHPIAGTSTPCATRGDKKIRECRSI